MDTNSLTSDLVLAEAFAIIGQIPILSPVIKQIIEVLRKHTNIIAVDYYWL